ncbi:hypothetical protein Aduo_006113 [Ancylostoma duodenale]
MTELAAFKTRISLACRTINALQTKVQALHQPFEFPTTATEYVAMTNTMARKEQSEREKLINDLDAFLNIEANETEIIAIQWTGRLNYRLQELEKQSSIIQARPTTSGTTSARDTDTDSTVSSVRHIENKMRLPQLEVPVFSGSYKDYQTFWTIYNSLIHSNPQLTNTDKFLFPRQALKGPAATLLGNMPVIGENYEKAVKLLDKRFNKSECIADLLITEFEKLPRAQSNAVSCRQRLTALTEKLTHIECSGVPLDNNRMWRRLILSKFPDTMSEKVLSKEQEQNRSFSTDEILNILENATAMKETIALTTDTFHDRFTLSHPRHHHTREGYTRHARFEQPLRNYDHKPKTTSLCVCGNHAHNVMQCPTFKTPEARRKEAGRRKLCWKCFNSSHKSSECNVLGSCPRCSRDHHSALCMADRPTSNTAVPAPRPVQSRRPIPNRFSTGRSRPSQNAEIVCQETAKPSKESEKQYVLMTATALAFNMDAMDYEPITVFSDTGAQKSLINAERSRTLSLPVINNTSFTVSGFGGLTETFSSNENSLTLKNNRSEEAKKGITIHTKSPLTSAMSTAKLSLADRKFIRKQRIRVAQLTLEDTMITPDILLGQDLIDIFLLRNEAFITLPSGLVLTPTVFGYAISGNSSVSGSQVSQTLTENGAILVTTPVVNQARE